jgi:catechol-2,3-dioxygenase
MIMFIEELHIATKDLAGAKKFYQGALGLNMLEESSLHMHFGLETSLLGFHAVENTAPQYHIAFNIPCNQVREALAWLSARTEIIPVEGGTIADFKNWNAQAVYFFDHDRNIIEFIARDDLRNNAAEPFGSRSILSVSEMGIVTDHVAQTCESLIKEYGLDYFSRQKPSKDFAALGDDHGLFIVAASARNWYPTDIPAARHWFRLKFEQMQRELILESHKIS